MTTETTKYLNADQSKEEIRYWIDREQEIRRRIAEINDIRQNMTNVLSKIGVPPKWLDASFDGCGDLPADLVKCCKGFAGNPTGIMFLTGIPGSGKTWLAVAIVRHCLSQGLLSPNDCLYVSERSFLDSVRSAFDEGGEHLRVMPGNHPQRVPFLIFDDLGSTRLTDWGRGEIANLIEDRHARDLPTVITANISPDDLSEVIDGRISSRIAESRQMLVFPNKDLRVFSDSPRKGNADVELEDADEAVISFLKRLYEAHESEIQTFVKDLSTDELIELVATLPESIRPDYRLSIDQICTSGFWKLRLWQSFAIKQSIKAVETKIVNRTPRLLSFDEIVSAMENVEVQN
jgi:DNA replication protein DnaC